MYELKEHKQKNAIILEKSSDEIVKIQNLNIASPHGAALLSNMNFTFEPGKSFLLCGPSGLGKSTLFRAIAGAWYYGSGSICLPEHAEIMFLPQKPYLPLGTLKDALSYPQPNLFEDEQILNALEQCHLSKFYADINRPANWSQTLSLGEQQLLAFCRILLHKPSIIFLDESTSALDEAKEMQMYACIRQYLPQAIIISVGHRNSLHQFHDEIIRL